MERIKKILNNDLCFLIIVSLAVILIVEAPTIYGYCLNNKSHYYTGLSTIGAIDGSVYLSYIEQVKAGHYLLLDLFNSDDNFRVLNPFWLMVGLVAKIFKLAAPLTLFLFHILLIPLFILALFKIVDLFFIGSQWQKKLCFLFSLIISGLGIFVLPLVMIINLKPGLGDVPIDLWAYETNNFMILRYYPHAILSISLIFLIFYYFYKGLTAKTFKKIIGAGILALFLFAFHPFQVPVVYAVTLLYILILFIKNKKVDWDIVRKYLIFLALSLASVIYYLYLILANKNIFKRVEQNSIWMSDYYLFIISFGLGLFLALYYVYYIFKKKKYNEENIFLIVWFLTNILLIYSPLNFQRRMLGSLMTPLAILAFSTVILLYNKIKHLSKPEKFIIISTFVILISLSNLFVYSQDFKYYKDAFGSTSNAEDLSKTDNLVYVAKDVKAALDWYKQNSTEADIILSSYEAGNLIPGITGRRVYLGHPIETVNIKEKKKNMANFFANNFNDEQSKLFLRQNKITYIFYSELEKSYGADDFFGKNYLEPVFNNQAAIIFKVIN